MFSADARIVPDARKLPQVSFEEILEMAASGAKVLQLRAVEYARTHRVRIHCRSSFEDAPGTVVLGEEETMEHPLITAVTHSRDEARLTLLGVPDHPGVSGRIFTALAEANINVDMIIQDEPDDEGAESWTSAEGRVALGHRRLSIVDLSPAGHNPMPNEDGSIWITYNGEVYNHKALRAEFEHYSDVGDKNSTGEGDVQMLSFGLTYHF